MKAENWSGITQEAGSPIEELAIKYSVAFPWGTFQVTDGAHEAYGLMPLTPSTDSGKPETAPIGDKKIPPIDIILLGPEDIKFLESDSSPEELSSGSFTRVRRDSKGRITIAIGLTETTEAHRQHILKRIVSTLKPDFGEVDDEDILRRLVDFEDIPLEESLQHNLPQAFVSGLAQHVSDVASGTFFNWQEGEMKLIAVRHLSRLGKMAVAKTAAMTALWIELNPRYPFLAAIPTSLFLIDDLGRMRRRLKDLLLTKDDIDSQLQEMSLVFGRAVATDIYNIYNRRLFDEQARQSLEN
ncbi:MAG TPA: hypothetical protein VLG37_01675 [Candidatus Saccharimonadales bacterium]|nr:hypothetical protein [Candidatus Saccharimonadales bacterium]